MRGIKMNLEFLSTLTTLLYLLVFGLLLIAIGFGICIWQVNKILATLLDLSGFDTAVEYDESPVQDFIRKESEPKNPSSLFSDLQSYGAPAEPEDDNEIEDSNDNEMR